MVAALDGSTSIDGRSAGLGGEADALAFRRLRDATDVVLVGAATVRAEGYGPGAVDGPRRAARLARGLSPHPRIVVVSARADLGVDHALLGPRPDDAPSPLLVVPSVMDAPSERRLAALVATGRLEVARVGTGGTMTAEDLVAVLDRLGARAVLCEGGPTLASQLVTADLVDETFLTIAPMVVGADGPRLLAAPSAHGRSDGPAMPGGPAVASPLRLVELWEHDDELLLRHRRRRGPAAPGGPGLP